MPHPEYTPSPPADLSEAALHLWQRHLANLADDAGWTPTEERLIDDAARAASLADALDAELASTGFTITTATGLKPSPLLAEIDRARRLTAALLKQYGQRPAAEASADNGARAGRRPVPRAPRPEPTYPAAPASIR